MAVVTPALLDQNLTKVTGVVRTVSSAQAALPSRFLDDQALGKKWRSQTGWNIVAGVNDKMDFKEPPAGASFAATITAGNYSNATDMCTAIVAALEAADPTPVWACTYSSSLRQFTISTDTPAKLLTNTGTNVATSPWVDFGYSVASDNNGAAGAGLTFTSTATTRHSREWIAYDFGSATAITAAIALKHNLGSGSGTITVQSSATSVVAAITAPTVTQTLTGDTTLVYKLFASQSHRYVVFLISDVDSTDAYSEMSISYLGTYRVPKGYAGSLSKRRGSLSVGTQATEGALLGDLRSQERKWALMWKNLESTDQALFEAFFTATPEFKCFFLHLDTTAGTSSSLIYGYRDNSTEAALNTETAGLVYDTAILFRETLP